MTDDRFRRTLTTAGFANEAELPRGPNGHCLCRYCGTEVQPPKRTFCSPACVEQWKIRTQPAFAKIKVFERDNGFCKLCGRDCLKPLTRQKIAAGQRVSRAARGAGWHMDHVTPVVEGGGACGLDNLRTLCIPCHKAVTAELARRRAQGRRKRRGIANGQAVVRVVGGGA